MQTQVSSHRLSCPDISAVEANEQAVILKMSVQELFVRSTYETDIFHIWSEMIFNNLLTGILCNIHVGH